MKTQPIKPNQRYKSMDQRRLTRKNLEQLAAPTASFNAHQAHLKQALLAASRPNKTINLKGIWRETMTKKKFVMSGAAMFIAVLAAVTFLTFGGPSQAAFAEQLTNQGLQNISKLTGDEQRQLNLRLNGNAEDELTAAKKAKDLQVLTYEEFQKLTPHVQSISMHGPDGDGPGPSSLNPSNLKYLKYTDSDGATHVIGLDQKGMPAMIMVFQDNADGSSFGSMQVMEDGNVKGTVNVRSAGDTSSAPAAGQPNGASCAQSSTGEMHCTTNGAMSSPDCQTLANGAVTCSAHASMAAPTTN